MLTIAFKVQLCFRLDPNLIFVSVARSFINAFSVLVRNRVLGKLEALFSIFSRELSTVLFSMSSHVRLHVFPGDYHHSSSMATLS